MSSTRKISSSIVSNSQKQDTQSREKHQLEHQDRRITRSVSRQQLNQAPELLSSSVADDVERNATLRPQELRLSRRRDASASDNGVVASNSSIQRYYCFSNNVIPSYLNCCLCKDIMMTLFLAEPSTSLVVCTSTAKRCTTTTIIHLSLKAQ
jgi:hypothetical protein